MTHTVSGPRTLVPKPSGALRIFAIVYAAQAVFGITVGVGYAVWLLYW
jgi:hypothetical protein